MGDERDKHELCWSIEEYKQLWEKEGNKKESTIINMLIVCLISSDTLWTKADCAASRRELLKLQEALRDSPSVKPENREKYGKYLADGLQIVERDYMDLPD